MILLWNSLQIILLQKSIGNNFNALDFFYYENALEIILL